MEEANAANAGGAETTEPSADAATTTPAGAAGAPPADPNGSLANGAGGEPQAWFPDDWREKMSGGDEGVLKFLQRQTDPGAAAKAAYGMRQEISKRGPQRPGDGASDEQWAEWRKSQGIPAAANEYRAAMQLPDGYDPERDAAVLDAFGERFHKHNIPAAQANDLVNAYFDQQQARLQEFAAATAEVEQRNQHALVEEWGGLKPYQQNISAIQRLADEVLGAEERAAFFDQVTVDDRGNPTGVIGNSPALLKLLSAVARDRYGEDMALMDSGFGTPEARGDRINELTAQLRASRKGGAPFTAANQQELDKLTAAQLRAAGKL